MPRESAEIAAMFGFFTRLPVGWTGIDGDELAAVDLARASRFAALPGAALGLIAAIAVIALSAVGLPPLAAAIGGIVVLLMLSGALHEDGLADLGDAFGASTAERRLEIMRDSRIGTYGAIALWASLSLRAACIAALVPSGGFALCGALVGAHALSRSAALYLPYALPSARLDGASASFGRPEEAVFRQSILIALALAAPALWIAAGIAGAVVAIALAAAAAVMMMRSAEQRFGGQTGDLIGATQQLCEIAILAAVTMFAAS